MASFGGGSRCSFSSLIQFALWCHPPPPLQANVPLQQLLLLSNFRAAPQFSSVSCRPPKSGSMPLPRGTNAGHVACFCCGLIPWVLSCLRMTPFTRSGSTSLPSVSFWTNRSQASCPSELRWPSMSAATAPCPLRPCSTAGPERAPGPMRTPTIWLSGTGHCRPRPRRRHRCRCRYRYRCRGRFCVDRTKFIIVRA